jgi:MFS family permease
MAQIHFRKFLRARIPTSFRWFLACTFASAIGRNGYAVACSWLLVSSESGSAAVAIFVAIISLTELLFSPIAGWVSDRFSRRAVFIAADCLRMIAAAALMWAASPWMLWCSAGVFAACDRAALTASQAMIPSVGEHLVPGTSNSISFFCMQAGGLVAAGFVGVLLHSYSGAIAFAVITAAFLISVCSMAFVTDVHSRPVLTSQGSSAPIELGPRFWHLVCVFALLYGAGTLVSILGAGFVLDELGGDALDFGQLESAWSAGSIVGAILLIPLAGLSKKPVLLVSVLIMIALLFASLELSILPWILLTFAALGALYNLGRVAVEVTLQGLVPHVALGRAKGLFHCAGVSMGLLLFGAISLSADRVAPSTIFQLYSGLIVIATGFLALLRPDRGKAAAKTDSVDTG